ncbi:MAG: ribosomal protein S18-alanine N-acetyltransferase [Firmicutes bacterium]|nr:ribosomal protein S18-alanine N-acetyltransferase [Bacillota bacterium]
MTVRDIDRVLVIERASFSAPWSRNAFLGELTENHFARYLLLSKGGTPIGYGGMWVIIDEAHVTNIAVLPDHRGQRLGERMLRQLMAEAIALGARKMTLEVRVSNQPALGLYRKLGFQDGGIRRGYYTDNHEDALVMWVELPELTEAADGIR